MTQSQAIAQGLGFLLAAIIAALVAVDARRRGLPWTLILSWSMGVLLVLIVFLPLYLWERKRALDSPSSTASGQNAPCRYCEYLNAPGADYCGKCGRQLKSSTEIHR